jgi:hypothetical protein
MNALPGTARCRWLSSADLVVSARPLWPCTGCTGNGRSFAVSAAQVRPLLGPLYQRLNRGDEGLWLLCDALKRMRKLASPHYTAEALFALAELEAVRGDIEAAREHFAEAKGLYDSMCDPRADEVASRLGQLGIPEA